MFGFAQRTAAVYVALSAVFMLFGQWLLEGNLDATDALFGVACFFWMSFAPVLMLNNWAWRRTVFCALGMLLLFVAWYSAAILFVHVEVLLAVFAVVWTADSAAYFVGKRWGKTPLAPFISPGKTAEGLAGGIISVLVLAYFFGPLLFVSPPTIALVSLAMVAAAFAVLGDLFESFLKRRCGVKDSGVLLGSHGGVLDRLDAMLPVLPFAALLSPWLT